MKFCLVCLWNIFSDHQSPLARTFTFGEKTIKIKKMYHTQAAIGKDQRIMNTVFYHLNHEFIPNLRSFNRERELWKRHEPLPYKMKNLSVIVMDGFIYAAGQIMETENYSSNFLCYNPDQQLWTEKAHTNINQHKVILVMVGQSICVCNTEVGFMRYDALYNRWNKVLIEWNMIKRNKIINIILIQLDWFPPTTSTRARWSELYVRIVRYDWFWRRIIRSILNARPRYFCKNPYG